MSATATDAALFVGRGADLDALHERVASGAGLVTVTGFGGLGKTRLCREYAQQRGDEFSGGAWFVDLTATRGADELCAAVGAALGVPLTSGASTDDLVERLTNAIAARGRTLIVLDNFEQLVDYAPAAIGSWLRGATDAVFLVTSREKLGLPGERIVALEPIAREHAAELFIARAKHARSDFDGAGHADTVRQIALRLDCVPLAIELAAAQMHYLSPSELLGHLEHRFDVLDERGSVEWSWSLLSPQEAAALQQMAVFRGDFTIDALKAIVDTSGTSLFSLVDALTRKSVLRVIEPGRYRLFESMRHFAREKLSSTGQFEQTARRHAEHYGTSCSASYGAIGERMDERDLSNTLAAHRWALDAGDADLALRAAVAVAPLLIMRGPTPLLRSLLDGGIELAPDTVDAPGTLAAALHWRGQVFRLLGDHAMSIRDSERAIVLARQVGDHSLEANAQAWVGIAQSEQGERQSAVPRMEAALEAARTALDPRAEAFALSSWGFVDWYEDRVDSARSRFLAALNLARETGDLSLEGRILVNLGGIADDRGEEEASVDYMHRALACSRAIDDRQHEAIGLINCGSYEQAQGDFDEAERLFSMSRQIAAQIGAQTIDGVIELCTAALAQDAHGAEHGVEQFERARRLKPSQLFWLVAGTFRARLGANLAARGHLGDAEQAFTEADALLSCSNDSKVSDIVVLHRGHLLLAEARRERRAGNADAADRLHREADQRLRAIDARWNGPEADRESVTYVGRAHARRELAAALVLLRRSLPAPSVVPAGRAELPPDDALVIGHDVAWFRPPHSEPVNLGKRAPLQRILQRLVDERRCAPGRGLPSGELIDAGWPDEKIQHEAAINRLHVAIATLRRLGLRKVLAKRKDGYRLDEAIVVAEGYQLKTVLEKTR